MLTTCRFFSTEAIDVLYAHNIFALSAADVRSLFERSPHACRMRVGYLMDVSSVYIYDRSNLKRRLEPVEHLAMNCKNLKAVTIPYTNAPVATDADIVMRTEPEDMNTALAVFDVSRYGFRLCLQSNEGPRA